MAITNDHPHEKLWAVLSQDEKGNEGICMVASPMGPQLAVTGSPFVLEMYLTDIRIGIRNGEVPSELQIKIGEFTRTATREIKV